MNGADTLLFAAGGGGGAGYLATGVDLYGAAIGQQASSGGSEQQIGGVNGNGGGSNCGANSGSGAGYFTGSSASTQASFGAAPTGIAVGFRKGSVGSSMLPPHTSRAGGWGGGGGGSSSTGADNDKVSL